MAVPEQPADQSPAPRHVAILGAGPVGLDAALACAERGWSFCVYESADRVGANVRAWGHVRLFTPWSMNVSPAGDGDCLAQGSAGVDALRVPEPDFFVLGMKSYGRNSTFLLRVGYEQVEEVTGAYAAA